MTFSYGFLLHEIHDCINHTYDKAKNKENKGNKYFFNDCHSEGLGAGEARLPCVS